MKLKATLLAVFVAGFAASFAVAKPPPGKGNGKGKGGPAAPTSSVTTSADGKKVLYCHKTGNGRYVLVWVSKNSAHAKGKHKGDVPAVNGACPTAGTTGSTTDTTPTTTTVATTTVGTTTTTP